MSRRFSIVKPEDLWTGDCARELRRHGPDVRELWAYLLTGPTSDMWGLWHLELDTLVLHTGRKDAAVIKAFGTLTDLELAFYDMPSQFVYVPSMPETQFARWPLLPNDNNVRYAKRWYRSLTRNPFLGDWFDHHVEDLFLLKDPEACERREWAVRGRETMPGEVPAAAAPAPTEDLLGMVPAPAQKKKAAMTAGEMDAAFQKIADMYPKGDAIDRARKVFHKMKPTPELLQQIFSALQWQCRQPDWLKEAGAYAPRLDRYFEGKRWLDRPRRIPNVSSETVQAMGAVNDFVNDMRAEAEWKTHPTKPNGLVKR